MKDIYLIGLLTGKTGFMLTISVTPKKERQICLVKRRNTKKGVLRDKPSHCSQNDLKPRSPADFQQKRWMDTSLGFEKTIRKQQEEAKQRGRGLSSETGEVRAILYFQVGQ